MADSTSCFVCRDKLIKPILFSVQGKWLCYACFRDIGRIVNKDVLDLDDKNVDEFDDKFKKYLDITIWSVAESFKKIMQNQRHLDDEEKLGLFNRMDFRLKSLLEILEMNE